MRRNTGWAENPLNTEEILYWGFAATAGVAGMMIGSFLNVVIHRGPVLWGLVEGESNRGNFAAPRSYCPLCRMQLKWFELIPILSFALQRGRCSYCGGAIALRYPLVEFGGLIAGLISFMVLGPSAAAIFAAIFLFALLALTVIDLETGFLPDAITLPLTAIGFGANAFNLFVPWQDAAIGAVAGYGVFRLIGSAYEHWRGVEGLGQGDAKLLAAIGAWIGWMALPVVVLAGALATLAAVAIGQITGKKVDAQTPIPFGPGLCLGGALGLGAAALGGFAVSGL